MHSTARQLSPRHEGRFAEIFGCQLEHARELACLRLWVSLVDARAQLAILSEHKHETIDVQSYAQIDAVTMQLLEEHRQQRERAIRHGGRLHELWRSLGRAAEKDIYEHGQPPALVLDEDHYTLKTLQQAYERSQTEGTGGIAKAQGLSPRQASAIAENAEIQAQGTRPPLGEIW